MAHTHDVYDMENHFEINGSSRFIKETSETKLVVVQGDHKSEVLTFKMPRYIDGHDMTLCNKIRIHYINLDTKTNNKSADVYEVTDLTLCEECEDVLTFTWTIEAPATKYSGTLSFLVKFECTEGENVLYQWNTAKYVSVNVLAGIDNSEEFVEKYSNVLEEWYNELTRGADSIEELNQQALAEIELAKEDAKEDIQGKADATMAEMNQFSSNAYNSFKNDVDEKASKTLASIPEDYSELDSDVKDISIKENLFIKESILNGFRLTSVGSLFEDSNYFTTDFIPVINGETYEKNSPTEDVYHRFATYDNYKNFVSISTSNSIQISDSRISFVRFCGNISEIDTTTFYNSKKSAYDKKARSEIKLLNERFVKSEKTLLGYITCDFENLYTKENIINGKWVNSAGNILEVTNACYVSVAVEGGKDIYLCYNTDVAVKASDVSAIRFANNETKKSHITNIEDYIIGQYMGYSVVKCTVPDDVNLMNFTIKISPSFDATETMIVTYTDLTKCFTGWKPKVWESKKWACVGDSLTDTNTEYTTLYYFDYIREATGIEVVNMGKRGTSYAKGDPLGADNRFYDRIVNVPTDVDVVTIFGSVNDMASGLPIGDIDDTELTTVCGYINSTLDRLYSIIPTAQLGIIVPTPTLGGNPYETPEEHPMVVYINKLIDICKKRSIPYLDLYHGSNLRPWDATFRQHAFSKDRNDGGTHPDETGNKIIAPKILEFLKTLLMC